MCIQLNLFTIMQLSIIQHYKQNPFPMYIYVLPLFKAPCKVTTMSRPSTTHKYTLQLLTQVQLLTMTRFIQIQSNILQHYAPAWLRCSHNHMPCHVPNFSFPSVIGTVTLLPMRHDFT